MSNAAVTSGIQSTAGAVPVKNDKGELSMQKVKVHRYVSGKRPDYAPMSSSEEESEEEDFIDQQGAPVSRPSRPSRPPPRHTESPTELYDENLADDPRLRRLMTRHAPHSDEEEDRRERHRHIHEPEVVESSEEEEAEEVNEEPEGRRQERRVEADSSQSEDEEELSDEEIERRRLLLRQKLLARKEEQEPEVMVKEEDQQSMGESGEESSEYEEETDSEEEMGPRLKPVFVRKKDRITIMEKEKEEMKEKQAELEAKKMAEERKRNTLRMVEDIVRKETTVVKDGDEPKLADVNTDDENDEVEYEAWKLRELKRVKRDREEREAMLRERAELERIRNMTEEERRLEFRNNPKVITNRSAKGKYKFLQKYYHRGAFYLDNEQEIFKRDFSAATLEDHFDKTILPKVMQVKNFGRSGRTKYTHLVDQDTTQFESPWVSETAQNSKFYSNQAAGMKQNFEKPSLKKNRLPQNN
ncbi:Microfibrillar-associated protein 1 [Frankliniella fusca]|uniref:Microfibrillar-associated protein 1 n=1 Tax=Frankliniella fusca TaxID=407009 RepID=A0AAE1LPG7_9NEOP|nr:Microfibrillar-associated protein 1 [Frankliniella fusca]